MDDNQRLTGALLDRLTHHVHILELNGESYRLKQSKARRRRDPRPADEAIVAADPETAEIISAGRYLSAMALRPVARIAIPCGTPGIARMPIFSL